MNLLQARRKKAELLISYQRLFDSEDGQRVLVDLMQICGFMSDCMENEPHLTAYNEGKRSVIIRILNYLKTDPMKLLELLEDNRKE